MIDAMTRRNRDQIRNAPMRPLPADKFREWMRLTIFFEAIACGIAPSNAAIEIQVDKLITDGEGQQRKIALDLMNRVAGDITRAAFEEFASACTADTTRE